MTLSPTVIIKARCVTGGDLGGGVEGPNGPQVVACPREAVVSRRVRAVREGTVIPKAEGGPLLRPLTFSALAKEFSGTHAPGAIL